MNCKGFVIRKTVRFQGLKLLKFNNVFPSNSRDTDARSALSKEEQREAEESLKVYCKPVELYNILQRRAVKNPLFLQRCLHYKIQEKNKSKVQLSISINGAGAYGVQIESLFSLYILLARPVFTPNRETLCSSSYRFKRACKLTVSNGTPVKFLLPEIKKLSAEVKSGSLVMLLVSCGITADTSNPKEIDEAIDHMFSSSSESYCLLGKIPIDFLHLSWEESPNSSLEGKVQVTSTVIMQACYLKLRCSDEEKCVSFQLPYNSEAVSIVQQVPVIITAEELGAKDKSAYQNSISADLPPCSIRLKKGDVVFNFRYHNNMLQKSQVTEDFSCPFCLIKCASLKGLKWHLNSSHDLFHYECWANVDSQVVVVFPKTNTCTSEAIVGNMVDPRKQTFFFCYKPLKCRSRNQNANHVGPLALVLNMPETLSGLRGVSEHMECEPYSPNAAGGSGTACIIFARPESDAQTVPESCITPTAPLQYTQSRQLSIELSDPESRTLLEKRCFFHSHTAQPMALEQVFAEEDREDEIDDDIADLEDRWMLNDFVDVTQDEKQFMHLWNSFIRRQRVLADAHIPWACEAFSHLHGEDLLQTPQLNWWRGLILVKLWNQGLLDAKTINNHQMMATQTASNNINTVVEAIGTHQNEYKPKPRPS